MRSRKWDAGRMRILAAASAVLIGNLAAAACGSSQELALTQESVQEMSAAQEADAENAADLASAAGQALSEAADGAEKSLQESSDQGDGKETGTEMGVETETEAKERDETDETDEPIRIYVDVCGAVENPGVYCLEQGARVADAVRAAGGFSLYAVETCVNKARVLRDEERIYIYTGEELEALQRGEYPGTAAGALEMEENAANDGGSRAESASEAWENGKGSAGTSGGGKVNLNTAAAAELETLPGIGAAKAQAIVAYRQQNGNFGSAEELKKVSGIGDATYAKLEAFIYVE